ncbi:hypothetical protein MTo_00729 [Microcystis aeruginosa NIES-1211]|nr:hypothetical protein B5D77_19270 [Microcystis sp. MC19]GBL13439.1 hypothetical protein MTo_00729 [Microcystis aeruginosa NIES-1211]
MVSWDALKLGREWEVGEVGKWGRGGDVGEWGNGEFQLKSEHPKTLTPQNPPRNAHAVTTPKPNP